MKIENLEEVFIPTAIFEKKISKKRIQAIIDSINKEEAIIIFPAGEVSRFRFIGIRDCKWSKSFATLSLKYNVPILPIYVESHNSLMFYLLAKIKHQLGTALLPQEIFKKTNKNITFHFGKLITPKAIMSKKLSENEIVQKIRKTVYSLKKGNYEYFKTEQAIVSETDRNFILTELEKSILLGRTRDGKAIYLCNWENCLNTIREIGRLREITFRSVGEGTSKKLDLDKYDRFYEHIVLWDEDNQEIIGSYRLANIKKLIETYGMEALYTSTLFEFLPEFEPILNSGVEMGRSFIREKYWGSSALDYIWQGIGDYLLLNPEIRYIIGAVSISDDYPQEIKNMIVFYYQKWYPAKRKYVNSLHPVQIENLSKDFLENFFDSNNCSGDFKKMKHYLKSKGYSIPVLYRRYMELCDFGGSVFAEFSIDINFSDVVDGFLIVDTQKFSDETKDRYLSDNKKIKNSI